MDTATLSAIAIAITSLAGTFLAYRKFDNESKLARQQLTIQEKEAKASISTSITHAAAELMDDLREEIARLRTKVLELENANEKRKNEILKLSLELNQARERISVLEGENEELRRENEELRSRLDELK